MQRVNKSLVHYLAQRGWTEWQMACERSLTGSCASGGHCAGNAGAERRGNAPLSKPGCDIAGKLLYDEGPEYRDTQGVAETVARIKHGRAQASPLRRRSGEDCGSQRTEHEAHTDAQH